MKAFILTIFLLSVIVIHTLGRPESELSERFHQKYTDENTCTKNGITKCSDAVVTSSKSILREKRRNVRDVPILTKLRETVQDKLGLEKIFGDQLGALDNYLVSKLLPEGTGPIFPIPKLSLLPDMTVLRQLFHHGRDSAKSTGVCHACRIGVTLLFAKARSGIAINEVKKLVIGACKLFKISSPEVCTGLIEMYTPIIQKIAVDRPNLTPDRFCGVVLQSFGCIATDWRDHEWNVDFNAINDGYLEELSSDYYPNDNVPAGIETLKILHLADIHVDPDYIVGSNAVCENELCCREPVVGRNDLGEKKAGYWGDLRKCDLPYHSFEDTLIHITEAHPDIQMVYMTGDLVPHDVWTTDINTNIEIIHNVTFLLKKYFPTQWIIPVIGNHESHPVNLFAPKNIDPEYSTQWLYDATSSAWYDLIPKESMNMFKDYGYYDIHVTDGFRIIGLNTNFCYGFNFWQLYDYKDPGGQLQWLLTVLENSRRLGEKVHLVGHLPPGQEECASTWSRNFYDIIYKYRDIIKAQFYAHTHYDEMQVYFDRSKKSGEGSIPISSVWLGPSLSPFINLNPGYKIYTVDGARGVAGSTWNVIDAETWIFDLKDANKNPEVLPSWFRLYKATEEYEIPNTLPSSLYELIDRFSTNDTMFQKYLKNYYKGTSESLEKRCDTLCQKKLLCTMVTSSYDSSTECMELESEVDGIILPKRMFEKVRTIVRKPIERVVSVVRKPIGRVADTVYKPIKNVANKFLSIFKRNARRK